ncbi:MAG: hypothetical protein AABZ06_09395 [Bdellovibrionota bacterium]
MKKMFVISLSLMLISGLFAVESFAVNCKPHTVRVKTQDRHHHLSGNEICSREGKKCNGNNAIKWASYGEGTNSCSQKPNKTNKMKIIAACCE